MTNVLNNDTMKQYLKDVINNVDYKIIVLIDMDNTIVDYSTPIAEALSEHFGVNATYDNWTIFKKNNSKVDIETETETDIDINHETVERFQKSKQQEDGFFYSLKPIKGAIEALKEMKEMGFEVFIVSSPSVSSRTCHSDKVRWLKDHMGDEWARKLVLTKDKTIVYGHCLIDDREDIDGVLEGKRPWEHILFSQHYNVHIDKPRISKWEDWTSVFYNTLLQ